MKDEYFWSLVVEPGWLQAGIWTLEGDKVKIVSASKPTKWSSEEDMVETADNVLSDAIEEFPDEAKEPSKTVFGVQSNWVEEGSIKKEHLGKIRELCSKLSLSPTGFVVLPEAIAHSLKLKEGNPLSGVVIGLLDDTIDVSVFKLGNLVGTVNVGRSASLAEDVTEALTRFSGSETIPTKFLIYDGNNEEIDEAKQILINADWEKLSADKFKMLHTPQVDVVSPEEKTAAVSIAGASEIGEVKGVYQTDEKDDPVKPIEKEEQPNVEATGDLSPEDLGFVVDGEVQEGSSDSAQEPDTKTESKSKIKMPKFSLPTFGFLKNIKMPNIKKSASPKISNMDVGSESKLKKVVIGLAALLLIGSVALGIAWWYLPKAEVVVFIAPKTLEQMEVLTFSEEAESADIENRVFPAQVLSTEISGEKTVSSTGTITVGEKASGKVTIRNGTSTGIKLEAGTALVGPNDLGFVLDNSASVSAATSPSNPGTLTIDATAADIGAEYNLAKDENLVVGNFPSSEVDAIVEEEFTGGSSEEVVAVSEADISKVEEELTADLKRKVLSQLEGEASGDALFIADSVETSVVEENYSAQAGDQVNAVTLSLTLSAEGLTVPRPTINKFVEEVLASQVPDGFSLKSEQVETDFELIDEVEDGVWDFDVNIEANLLPVVDPDEIKRQVSGKYPPQAQGYLQTIPGYTRAEVRIKPRFPGRLGNIPRVLDNISVEIVADR